MGKPVPKDDPALDPPGYSSKEYEMVRIDDRRTDRTACQHQRRAFEPVPTTAHLPGTCGAHQQHTERASSPVTRRRPALLPPPHCSRT